MSSAVQAVSSLAGGVFICQVSFAKGRGGHRVVASPFPFRFRSDRALLAAVAGAIVVEKRGGAAHGAEWQGCHNTL